MYPSRPQRPASARLGALDAVLGALALLRLTRFITTDTLADWTIVAPAERWAMAHEDAARRARRVTITKMRAEHPHMNEGAAYVLGQWEDSLADDDPISWQARLVSGLHCPFCVGVHLAAILMVTYLVTARRAPWRKTWRAVAGILGANYVTAHISARVD